MRHGQGTPVAVDEQGRPQLPAQETRRKEDFKKARAREALEEPIEDADECAGEVVHDNVPALKGGKRVTRAEGRSKQGRGLRPRAPRGMEASRHTKQRMKMDKRTSPCRQI